MNIELVRMKPCELKDKKISRVRKCELLYKEAESRLMDNTNGVTVRLIPGFGGMYAATNHGDVISLRSGKILRWSMAKGYRLLVLSFDGIKYARSVHKLVALAFHGQQPSSIHQVNHINGIKTDNKPENLEWVTPIENTRHAIATNLFNTRGESHPRSKLTENDVMEIRSLRGLMFQREIADRFNVGQGTISHIHNRRNWPHLESQP